MEKSETMVDALQPSQLPIIDLSLISSPQTAHSSAIQQIRQACSKYGFFYVINHGISETVIAEAIYANKEFFEMPKEMKEEYFTDDIYRPVRLTKAQGGTNQLFSRDFLKLFASPLDEYLPFWPNNPTDYRGKMGRYTKQVRELANEIFGPIMESLNLGSAYLRESFKQGTHMLGINGYTECCSQSDIKCGLWEHTDHSIFTILLKSSDGLQVMDPVESRWKSIPALKGSLIVFVGDHLEAISNGVYKSPVHRAIPSSPETRVSIASWHNLAMEELVEPAADLVDEEHPRQYKGSSLNDFFEHLSSKKKSPFIDTIRIQ